MITSVETSVLRQGRTICGARAAQCIRLARGDCCWQASAQPQGGVFADSFQHRFIRPSDSRNIMVVVFQRYRFFSAYARNRMLAATATHGLTLHALRHFTVETCRPCFFACVKVENGSSSSVLW
ncbi:hypothetical protein SCLCIDRAFT_1212287 [Scleroderma citrinum Foug A]|uniref:Uncharacterized protein n=1 Tax=Scleroderma citrinum Foug A TaxID=1036808 RepID=A0A0C3DYB5_9AGAM|nr:hypothetical protein SCLCIDRAFT_1212287 [Scleroderma citrinum Foug A]